MEMVNHRHAAKTKIFTCLTLPQLKNIRIIDRNIQPTIDPKIDTCAHHYARYTIGSAPNPGDMHYTNEGIAYPSLCRCKRLPASQLLARR